MDVRVEGVSKLLPLNGRKKKKGLVEKKSGGEIKKAVIVSSGLEKAPNAFAEKSKQNHKKKARKKNRRERGNKSVVFLAGTSSGSPSRLSLFRR